MVYTGGILPIWWQNVSAAGLTSSCMHRTSMLASMNCPGSSKKYVPSLKKGGYTVAVWITNQMRWKCWGSALNLTCRLNSDAVSMDGIVKGACCILFGSCKTKMEGNATMEGSILSWPSPKKSFLLTPQVLKDSFFFLLFGYLDQTQKGRSTSKAHLLSYRASSCQGSNNYPKQLQQLHFVSCVWLLIQHVH